MKSDETSFGAELYAARTRRGLTQAVVALKAKLGRGYYSQLENSRKPPPSQDAMRRLVVALGLNSCESSRLISLAIAEGFKPTMHIEGFRPELRKLFVHFFEQADRITPEKVLKIETILKED